MNSRWKIAQWFERKWWKNYTSGKSPQQYLTWKKEYWKGLLKELNLTEINEPIADIGCGPAGVFTIFNDKEVLALDPLVQQYEQDLGIFKPQDYPSTTFVAEAFEHHTFNKKCRTVFCLNAINHFIKIEASFKKLNEILTDDGQLIVSIDAHNHAFFKHLFRFMPLDILHPHQYDLEEYKDFLSRNGFEINQVLLKKKEFFFNYFVIVASKVASN